MTARLLLSYDQTDLDHFRWMKPSPNGGSVVYSALSTIEGALFLGTFDSRQTVKLTLIYPRSGLNRSGACSISSLLLSCTVGDEG